MKIMFVCHGNICRSPMAEFVLRRMAEQEGVALEVSSSATSTEEIWNGIGNTVYPPAREELRKHGIDCTGKRAQLLRCEDYDRYDLLIGMDEENLRNMLRLFGGDPEGKVRKLLDRDVDDPWYYGHFDRVYQQIEAGCRSLLQEIKEEW